MAAAVKQGQNRTDIHTDNVTLHVCEKSLHLCARVFDVLITSPHLTESWSLAQKDAEEMADRESFYICTRKTVNQL